MTESADTTSTSTEQTTVTSDNPKTPWDVVKEIDWGGQQDYLKGDEEPQSGESPATQKAK